MSVKHGKASLRDIQIVCVCDHCNLKYIQFTKLYPSNPEAAVKDSRLKLFPFCSRIVKY